jgi:hypothetical protein
MPATVSRRPKRRTPQERTLITPPELALELGVTEAKIHAWIASGQLRAVDLTSAKATKRKRFGITREAIAEFLAARSTVPAPKAVRTRRADSKGIPNYFAQ